MSDKSFKEALEELINGYSLENDSNTPDFILAKYLQDCLGAFNNALIHRDKWYGHKPFGQSGITEENPNDKTSR